MNDFSQEKNPNDKKSVLDELKCLLLGDEQQSIEEIRHHVFDKKQRTDDLAEILPDSFSSESQDPERLSNSMNKVIHGSIRNLIKKDPQDFADALFPVMGPAIRRSINETLKSFMQSLNQVLEQNMSAQGMKWRFESWQKGVPYAELVLKHTLVYRVDEVFLIQPGSGLLIAHAAHPEAITEDSDAVSAMLSAIQDFIRDSFAEDKQSGLDTVELGEHTLWVMSGPQAILACTIRGIAPLSLRSKFKQILEEIHITFKDQLELFDGDHAGLELLKEPLTICLEAQRLTETKEEEKKSFLSTPLIIILLVTFIISSFLIWRNIDYSSRLEKLKTELDARAGVILYESNETNDGLQLKLLIDPLADSVDDLPGQYKFKADDLIFVKTAYQSLEPVILLRRVKQILQAPETVMFTEKENILYIGGVAPLDWINFSKPLLRSIIGYQSINIDELTPDYSAIEQVARVQLKIPKDVVVKFDGTRLHLSGQAPAEWILWYQTQTPLIEQINDEHLSVDQKSLNIWLKTTLSIPESVNYEIVDKQLILHGSASHQWITSVDISSNKNPWVDSIDPDEVNDNEALELEQIRQYINTSNIYFSDGTETVIGMEALLSQLAMQMRRISTLAKTLGYDIAIDIVGHTDGLGDSKKNSVLALKRASWVQEELLKNSVLSSLLRVKASEADLNDRMNLAERHVGFRVNIKTD
jgi:outer membrane protein OmpA-like peptidoglycan-associated protein